MRRPRHRFYHANADINIANLVDVVLVLLIIFMISAPLLQSGIEINLPKSAAPVKEEEARGVILSIDRKGGVYINDVFTNPKDFKKRLTDEMKRKSTQQVYLRGDSAIAYGLALGIVGQMKEMGIEQISLVTAHQDRRGRQSR